jgi:DNA gyrase subunit A
VIKIGELVREKRLEGISEIRDESDKSGMRMVIELKRGEVPEVVLNNLYKDTQMQDTFGMNMVALLDGQPRLLNLKQMLEAFLRHRREVITRRTQFELKKARERGHILEGLAVALANVDEIIALIKASATPAGSQGGADVPAWRSRAGGRNAGRVAGAQQGPEAFRPRPGPGIRPAQGRLPSSPTSRPRPFSICACNASPAWSRTRSSANTGKSWTASPTCWTSSTSPSGSPRSSPTELNAIKGQFGDKRRSEIVTTPRNSAWKT